jgi:hypothetical protein
VYRLGGGIASPAFAIEAEQQTGIGDLGLGVGARLGEWMMEQVDTTDKCPRCGVTPHPFLGEDFGANSRQTMDGAKPTITICVECRDREVFRGSLRLPPIPYSQWPVPLDALLAEDAARLAYLREKPIGEVLRARRRREQGGTA